MDKIWQKYLLVFVCFLITTHGIADNPDTTKIPCLKLNNYRIKVLIRDLIKDEKLGSIHDNDVLLISFIERNNEQYLFIGFSEKALLLTSTLAVRNQKFIGYSTIFNHDCYVFGDKSELFFKKMKDSVQIPKYFNWLLSLNHMEIDDFFIRHLFEDSDGYVQEVPVRVHERGVLYKYVKKHFILIPHWDSVFLFGWGVGNGSVVLPAPYTIKSKKQNK